jgi:hypothetical protein
MKLLLLFQKGGKMGEYSKNTKRYHQYLFLTVRGKLSQCHRLKKDEQLLSIQEKKKGNTT